MNIGTKSVLFGVHQFLLHPLFVAFAWWKLFGFPWDPRLWVAFVVHDLGYLGKPNMDGPEGETHPELGARIMGALFDWSSPEFRVIPLSEPADYLEAGRLLDEGFEISNYTENFPECAVLVRNTHTQEWHDFTLYHSRFYAKKHGAPHSRLCVADKLATVLMPPWLYLPLANLTGEISEYMSEAHHGEGGRYSAECRIISTQRAWFDSVRDYMSKWIAAHKDGQPDTWTKGAA